MGKHSTTIDEAAARVLEVADTTSYQRTLHIISRALLTHIAAWQPLEEIDDEIDRIAEQLKNDVRYL